MVTDGALEGGAELAAEEVGDDGIVSPVVEAPASPANLAGSETRSLGIVVVLQPIIRRGLKIEKVSRKRQISTISIEPFDRGFAYFLD